MDARTIGILQDEITHWENISNGIEIDFRISNSPLCQNFIGNRICYQCPVQDRTGKPHCNGTPIGAWQNHHFSVHNNFTCFYIKKGCNECQELAQKELDFLKSLLPDNG